MQSLGGEQNLPTAPGGHRYVLVRLLQCAADDAAGGTGIGGSTSCIDMAVRGGDVRLRRRAAVAGLHVTARTSASDPLQRDGDHAGGCR